MEMAVDGAATLMMVVTDEYSLTNTELELCRHPPSNPGGNCYRCSPPTADRTEAQKHKSFVN